MTAIEPNLLALAWFATFAVVASVAFYVLAGAFPLSTRPELNNPASTVLAGVDVLLLLALVLGCASFGVHQLRWTSLVIVAALAILFGPGIFQAWPERWRDGRTGLVILLGSLSVTLVALQWVDPNVY